MIQTMGMNLSRAVKLDIRCRLLKLRQLTAARQCALYPVALVNISSLSA
jgi:hypothetical protein